MMQFDVSDDRRRSARRGLDSAGNNQGAFIMATRKIAQTALLVFAMLLFVTAASAAPVTYVLSTPGVV